MSPKMTGDENRAFRRPSADKVTDDLIGNEKTGDIQVAGRYVK